MVNEPEPVIEMKEIRKAFPGIVANDGACFSLYSGEIHALVGENGAGKTTLMNILSGFIRRDSGKMLFKGSKVDFGSPKEALKVGICIVPQVLELVSSFTVAENIALGMEPKKILGTFIDRQRRDESIMEIIEKTGLDVPLSVTVGELAIGVQQRVEILKALYSGAEVLILDEPTSSLAPNEADQLFQVLRNLKSMGKSIIFISHKLREVFDIADRITVIRNGRTSNPLQVSDTNPEEISNLMFPDGKARTLETDQMQAFERSNDVVLKIESLVVKDLQGIPAIDDVSLTLRKSEILGIAGVSGNGQKELAEAIIGLREIHSGRLAIFGKDITKSQIATRRRLGITYIPDDRKGTATISSATVTENVMLGDHSLSTSKMGGLVKWKQYRNYCSKLCEEFHISLPGNNTELNAGKLSGGNLQKLVLAREFSRNPKVVVLFQPTQGLDISTTQYVYQRIHELAVSGTAILLISMDLDEILRISDRILVIFKGKLHGDFYPEDISKRELGLYMSGVKNKIVGQNQ